MSVPFIVFSAFFSSLLLTCKRCKKKRYVPISGGIARSLLLGFLLATLMACSESKTKHGNYIVSFTPSFAEQDLACNTPINIDNKLWSFSELAFFISELSIIDDHTSYPLTLVDNAWQSQNVALIRQSPDCSEKQTNLQIVLDDNASLGSQLSLKQSVQLRFTLGVPFDINHRNPVVQASPLNDSSMFWAWRNGYKFLRWDMQTELGDAWSFHLGSVGCESAAMVRAPNKECQYPNRIEVSLPLQIGGADNNEIRIRMDLAAILGELEPIRSNTCMFSSIDEQHCQALLTNVSEETVFSVLPVMVAREE